MGSCKLVVRELVWTLGWTPTLGSQKRATLLTQPPWVMGETRGIRISTRRGISLTRSSFRPTVMIACCLWGLATCSSTLSLSRHLKETSLEFDIYDAAAQGGYGSLQLPPHSITTFM